MSFPRWRRALRAARLLAGQNNGLRGGLAPADEHALASRRGNGLTIRSVIAIGYASKFLSAHIFQKTATPQSTTRACSR